MPSLILIVLVILSNSNTYTNTINNRITISKNIRPSTTIRH